MSERTKGKRRTKKSNRSAEFPNQISDEEAQSPKSIKSQHKGKHRRNRRDEEQDEEKIRYDPSQRQTLPPANIDDTNIPQFEFFELNGVKIAPREGQDFTINELVSDAKPGTTITIPKGTYKESIIVTKPIKFITNGSVKIVSSGSKPAITVMADGVSFRGFEIAQRHSNAAPAIIIENGSANFIDCNVKADGFPALIIRNRSIVNGSGCRFVTKSAPDLFASEQSNATFEICNFLGSSANGVVLKDDAAVKMVRCAVQGFAKSGIVAKENSRIILEKTRISGCALHGLEITSTSISVISDSSIEGCGECGITAYLMGALRLAGSTIEGCGKCGLEVRDGAAVRLSDNVFSHCGAPAALYAFENATIDSFQDQFYSTGPLAVASLGTASVMMRGTVFRDIVGRGALVSGQAVLNLAEARFERTDATAVTCVQGGDLILADSYVLNSGELGVAISECNSAQLVRTHVDSCALSGLEVTGVQTGLSIDQCNFSRCRQCGAVAIDSHVEMTVSNAMENHYTGFEARSSTLKLYRCTTTENAMGGVCARASSSLIIDTCVIQKNGQCGMSLESASTGVVKNTTVELNKRLGIAVVLKSFLTMKNCVLTDHACTALQIEGSDSRALLDRCKVAKNDVGVLALMSGRLAIAKTAFEENGMHVELRDRAKMKASESQFSGATDKAALNFLPTTEAAIESSAISASQGVGVAADCRIEMQVCQVFDNEVGIFLYGGAEGVIKNCRITHNGPCGILVKEGSVKIQKNVIEEHSAYGISVEEDATPVVDGNEFRDNAVDDVNRA